jgi:hypothetical protein
MLGDFFTKPLQGTRFFQHRDTIMNIDPSSLYHSDHRSVLTTQNRNRATDHGQNHGVVENDVTDTTTNKTAANQNNANATKTYLEVLVGGERCNNATLTLYDLHVK